MRAMWIVSKGMESKKHMKSHVDSQAESQGEFDGVRRKAVSLSQPGEAARWNERGHVDSQEGHRKKHMESYG